MFLLFFLEGAPSTPPTEKRKAEDDIDVDGSPVLTLKEALEEYEELEKVSTAVLGASDPQNCSYSKVNKII